MLYNDIIISGQRAICKSYAKINLTLDVLSRLENGYHEVEMIMQTLSLFDLIIIDKTKGGISLGTNLRYLPTNEKNIAYKAALLFLKEAGIEGGVKINIHKNIPVSAGLAGGSGNAAAVLCALNMLYDFPFGDSDLLRLGASLGADVPYCMQGGTKLSKGIGDVLSPLPKAPKMTVLLVKPPISVSTASIYQKIDSITITQRPDTNAMISALESKDINLIANNLCNTMESVTEQMYPVIRGIKTKMLLNGALGSLMSGSGPTVFGIFDDYSKSKASADSFAFQYKDVFLTSTIDLE